MCTERLLKLGVSFRYFIRKKIFFFRLQIMYKHILHIKLKTFSSYRMKIGRIHKEIFNLFENDQKISISYLVPPCQFVKEKIFL
jgi:hypothetical protein